MNSKFSLLSALLPYSVAVAVYLIAPGYLRALETNWAVVYGLASWHLIGILLLSRASKVITKIIISVLFVLPLILLPIAGPFAICCFQSCSLQKLK